MYRKVGVSLSNPISSTKNSIDVLSVAGFYPRYCTLGSKFCRLTIALEFSWVAAGFFSRYRFLATHSTLFMETYTYELEDKWFRVRDGTSQYVHQGRWNWFHNVPDLPCNIWAKVYISKYAKFGHSFMDKRNSLLFPPVVCTSAIS